MKRILLTVGLGIGGALLASTPADAFFGHRWASRHSGCGGSYYGATSYAVPTGYSYGYRGYSPYSYRSTYGYPSTQYRSGYRGGYGYGTAYGYGGYGYRGYSGVGVRASGYGGLLGRGNGYYYGGFPMSRASGIGLVPGFGYGW